MSDANAFRLDAPPGFPLEVIPGDTLLGLGPGWQLQEFDLRWVEEGGLHIRFIRGLVSPTGLVWVWRLRQDSQPRALQFSPN